MPITNFMGQGKEEISPEAKYLTEVACQASGSGLWLVIGTGDGKEVEDEIKKTGVIDIRTWNLVIDDQGRKAMDKTPGYNGLALNLLRRGGSFCVQHFDNASFNKVPPGSGGLQILFVFGIVRQFRSEHESEQVRIFLGEGHIPCAHSNKRGISLDTVLAESLRGLRQHAVPDRCGTCDQRPFILEMVVGRGLGDAGAAGHGAKAHGLKAFLFQNFKRGMQKCIAQITMVIVASIFCGAVSIG